MISCKKVRLRNDQNLTTTLCRGYRKVGFANLDLVFVVNIQANEADSLIITAYSLSYLKMHAA